MFVSEQAQEIVDQYENGELDVFEMHAQLDELSEEHHEEV